MAKDELGPIYEEAEAKFSWIEKIAWTFVSSLRYRRLIENVETDFLL